MLLSIFTWTLLVVIAVSDARAHRIPNKLLMLLLVLLCLNMYLHTPQEELWSVFLDKIAAFGVAFIFAIALHLFRVMAPGDVKLIAVLGLFLGTGGLVSYLFYVCLITAFVGIMYGFLNRLHTTLKAGASGQVTGQSLSIIGIAVSMQVSQQALKKKLVTGNDLSYMPFAPILVMGLALHQYYSKLS